jgi:phosphatidylglycerophosphate synthase
MNESAFPANPVQKPPLEAWSLGNALALLAALAPCAYLEAAWPTALFAVPSFLMLVVLSRHALTPSGRFGLANGVTSLRFALVLALSAPSTLLAERGAVALALGILLLDLLDGWLARARGDASLFGAHFDMETDALLVFVVTLRLWLVQGHSAWVLTAGLLRYVYVLSLWLAPGSGREAPRSRLGRYAFSSSMLGLIGGLWLHGAESSLCVAAGTAVVSLSFARSFYFSHAAS